MIITIRQALIAAAVAGFLLLALFGAWKWREAVLARERGLRVAAEQTAAVATETTRIIERTMTHERTVEREADRAVEAVQEAPGAETPIPPELLDVWGRAIDGLRNGSPASPAADP
jgi:hypothetical protein